MEIIGWIGGVFFAICGLPQAIRSIRDGHSRGIEWGFLVLWLLGEVFSLIYVIPLGKYPLLFNYLANIVFTLTILKYKIWERKNEGEKL